MDIDADPAALERDARQIGEVAADLFAAAHRLTSSPTLRGRPGSSGSSGLSTGVAGQCAALAAGLRADAAELVDCADRLRATRVGLLGAEATAVAALDRAAERAWWER